MTTAVVRNYLYRREALDLTPTLTTHWPAVLEWLSIVPKLHRIDRPKARVILPPLLVLAQRLPAPSLRRLNPRFLEGGGC